MTTPDPALDPCGCCEPGGPRTPQPVTNRPGLSSLAYRVGTHGTFKQSMLAGLLGRPALSRLTTRDDDDPAIALLDAWATVLDVLTFYQERIAGEGYLRTAAERRSVLELARTIGYEPQPGVAAAADLAFEVESAEGAPATVTIEAGTRVQSVPGPAEDPQTFETVGTIQARPAWNALRPRVSQPWSPGVGDTQLYLEGVATRLRPGDAILVVGAEREGWRGSERWDFRLLTSVELDPDRQVTRVTWEAGLGAALDGRVVQPAAEDVRCYALRRRAGLFGHNAPDWLAMPQEVRTDYTKAFPDHAGNDWPGLTIGAIGADAPERTLFLDAVYPGLVPGSWLVLSSPGYSELYRPDPALGADAVAEASRTGFTLSAKVTRVTLEGENLPLFDDSVRDTVVFCESEELAVAEPPLTDPIQGDTVPLAEGAEGLEPGRTVIVRGRRPRVRVADGVEVEGISGGQPLTLRPREELEVLDGAVADPATGEWTWTLRALGGTVVSASAAPAQVSPVPATADGEQIGEVAAILAVEPDGTEPGRHALRLSRPLRGVYDRWSVEVLANVAPATHGETRRDEVLGSGGASDAFQELVLAHGPLTHVSAPTPSGSASTLEVRVGGVAWRETPRLFGLEPRDRAYAVRADGEGRTTVRFGDGRTGARLPSGTDNVTATYRTGTGRAGNLQAGQLSLLMDRPLGVNRVANPLPATGGEDPEDPTRIRRNAPSTVLTFDRVVSLTDYQDFAGAFAGIAKARAAWVWDGATRLAHVTVAGPDGAPVREGSEIHRNLRRALRASGDPHRPFRVASYEPLTFGVEAGVFPEPDHRWEDLRPAVATALQATFSFDRRRLGQPVTATEVIAAIQAVEGVLAVDLDALTLTGHPPAQPAVLPVSVARWEGGALRPAQLLTLNRAAVVLTERS